MVSNASYLWVSIFLNEIIKSWKCKKYKNLFHSISFFKLFILSVGIFSPAAYSNNLIDVPMDLSNWYYEGNRFECNLIHSNISEGKFYFRSEVRGSISFVSTVDYEKNKWHQVSLIAQSAPWDRANTKQTLSSLTLSQPAKRFVFHHGAKELFDSVSGGNWIALQLLGNKTSGSVALTLPTVKIREPLEAFSACSTRLPLMSYQQARNLAIYFQPGQNRLSAKQKQVVAALYSYMSIDSRINKVLIDGHTDNQGPSLKNLTLSRVRAQQVADELKQLGIADERIEVRAHGDRYPIASNANGAGRAKNRRVVLRLVKKNEQTVSTRETQQHQQKKNKVQK